MTDFDKEAARKRCERARAADGFESLQIEVSQPFDYVLEEYIQDAGLVEVSGFSSVLDARDFANMVTHAPDDILGALDALDAAEKRAEEAEMEVEKLSTDPVRWKPVEELVNSKLAEIQDLSRDRDALRAEVERYKLPPEPADKDLWQKLLDNLAGMPEETRGRILGNVQNLRARERDSLFETMPDGMTYPPWTLRRKWEESQAEVERLRKEAKKASRLKVALTDDEYRSMFGVPDDRKT